MYDKIKHLMYLIFQQNRLNFLDKLKKRENRKYDITK